MRVEDYEYNGEADAIISQERKEQLIAAVELKIRKDSIAHFEILKIGKNDNEFEFLYKYLEEKGIAIRGTNITMEDVKGYEEVAKAGANYYDLPEVIKPELEYELFEKLHKIREEKTNEGIDYLKDDEYKSVRAQIANGHLRLAKYITTFKPFRNINIDSDDLFAFAYRGLSNAIDKFDHTKGFKFSTYAWIAIHRRIEREIANEFGINENRYLEYKQMQDTKQLFFEETGREATVEDLRNMLGFTTKKIIKLLDFEELIINPDSIEEKVYEENIEQVIDNHPDSGRVDGFYTEEGYEYFEDGVAIEAKHEDAIDFENDIEKEADETFLRDKLMELLKTIKPREAKVLMMRFGLIDGRPKTLEEIGNEFNVTGNTIRQIEAKALRRLRYPVRSKQIRDFID